MAKYRHDLPMGKRQPFLLDGGLEITLVFLDGIDLPCFAPYPLIAETSGRMKALMPKVWCAMTPEALAPSGGQPVLTLAWPS
ncbi:MAG: hypothetical protein ACR2OL_15835 [Anderseniella sp.]